VDVCHGNKCLHIVSDQFTRNVKRLTRLSLENGIRQTWFHLYVSGSVHNQIHMHILLYYICRAVQCIETAWNLNVHCRVNILI